MKKRNVVILGSTGSIGVNALDVVRRYRREFHVLAIAAQRQADKVIEQALAFRPKHIAMADAAAAKTVRDRFSRGSYRPAVYHGIDGISRLASLAAADIVLCGMVGGAGLLPLLAAIKAGKTVGLANKEALVIAGSIVQDLSARHNAPIIPVDSEHSAIYQCLQGHKNIPISRIILTASGGPFYRHDGNLDRITVAQALNHPTWKMGNKITVDSATLMNKGLEAIEAHFLFGVPMNQIEIVIHPQSIVHSLVEFQDGAMLAQLSHPDMRLPIQYALTQPHRVKTAVKRMNLPEIAQLTFAAPHFNRFPCLKLALNAGKVGGTAPAVLSSANEEAVYAFIHQQISFMDIPSVVRKTLKAHRVIKKPTLKDVMTADSWARLVAKRHIENVPRSPSRPREPIYS